MKTLSLKIPETIDRRLAEVVARRGISKSDAVREALEAYLSADKKLQPGPCWISPQISRAALRGPGDLSTNPRYMKNYAR